MTEFCAICGCKLHRTRGTYALPTILGRSHATKHHYVPERFYGISKNRKGAIREGTFKQDPWGMNKQSEVFCYDCHEELIHNPVLLPEDILQFKKLVNLRGLNETEKTNNREKLGGRIILFNDVIKAGLATLLNEKQ
jgi:hypothetical protein